ALALGTDPARRARPGPDPTLGRRRWPCSVFATPGTLRQPTPFRRTVMKVRAAAVVAFLFLVAGGARADDGADGRDSARQELLKLQGTWQLQSPAKADKERTLFIGGDVFLVREGDRIVQAGTLRLSPAKKGVDAIVRKGQHEGNTMLGVYELKGDTLKFC